MSDIPDEKVKDTQEFFENHSQMNALNAKRTFDEFQDISLTAARRSQVHFDSLNSTLLQLQTKVNESFFASEHQKAIELETLRKDSRRHSDMWAYEQAYDLGNPVTTGAGDALRSTAYTPNRAVDVAAAGVSTANVAVAAAIADAITASIPILTAAVGKAVEAALSAAAPKSA